MNSTGHHFEDRLWDDLIATHGAELAATERAEAPTRFRRLRWSGAAVAATVAAILGLLVAGSGSPAAFAVTPHADGSVTISLRNVHAVKAANAALSRLHTRVVILPAGAPVCPVVLLPTFRAAPMKGVKPETRFVAGGVGTVTVPKVVGAGEVITLKVLRHGNQLVLRGYALNSAVCRVARPEATTPGSFAIRSTPRSTP